MLVRSLFLSSLLLGASAGAQTVRDPAAVVEILGLRQAQVNADADHDRGTVVTGILGTDVPVRIDMRRDDTLREITATTDRLFAIELIEPLIPAPVIAHAEWPKGSKLHSIDFERDRRIALEGWLANGTGFDAVFRVDGTLLDLELD